MFSKKSWFMSGVVFMGVAFATTALNPLFAAEDKAKDKDNSTSTATAEKSSDTAEQTKLALDVIQNQFSALRTGDVSRAYFTFTTKEFRQITSLENFRQFIKNFPVLSKVKTFDSQQKDFANNIWTIQGVLTSQDGETLGVEYEISQENGEWKIMGMQLFKATPKPVSTPVETPKVVVPAPAVEAPKTASPVISEPKASPVSPVNAPNGSLNK